MNIAPVIKQIKAAFRNVQLGHGVSLHVAAMVQTNSRPNRDGANSATCDSQTPPRLHRVSG